MEEKIIEIIENLTDYKDMKCNKDIDLLENEILDSLAFIELIETLIPFLFELLKGLFNSIISKICAASSLLSTQVKPDTWRSVKNIAEYIQQLKK